MMVVQQNKKDDSAQLNKAVLWGAGVVLGGVCRVGVSTLTFEKTCVCYLSIFFNYRKPIKKIENIYPILHSSS